MVQYLIKQHYSTRVEHVCKIQHGDGMTKWKSREITLGSQRTTRGGHHVTHTAASSTYMYSCQYVLTAVSSLWREPILHKTVCLSPCWGTWQQKTLGFLDMHLNNVISSSYTNFAAMPTVNLRCTALQPASQKMLCGYHRFIVHSLAALAMTGEGALSLFSWAPSSSSGTGELATWAAGSEGALRWVSWSRSVCT